MVNGNLANFKQHMLWMMVISLLGWVGFLLLFRSLWPGNTQAGGSLGVFWLWIVVGVVGSVLTALLVFRLMKTPAAWRVHAAAALTAPAMCLDVLGTVYFEQWFLAAGTVDDRLYPALILAGVAAILFTGLATGEE